MLVGDQHIAGILAAQDLFQQQVGLTDPLACGKGPVGAHALAGQLGAAADAGIIETAGRHQTPHPGQSRRDDMHQPHDAVAGMLFRGGGHADAKAPHIHLYRLVYDMLDGAAGNDDSGVGTGGTVGIQRVLPEEAGGPGHALNVEEHQRLFRVDGDALIERVGPVLRDAVHPDEPAVLSVKEG